MFSKYKLYVLMLLALILKCAAVCTYHSRKYLCRGKKKLTTPQKNQSPDLNIVLLCDFQ